MSNTTYVTIKTIENVKEFADICQQFADDIDVCSGRYIIDAKSIMGLMSINLLEPVEVTIRTFNENIIKDFMNKINKFTTEYFE